MFQKQKMYHIAVFLEVKHLVKYNGLKQIKSKNNFFKFFAFISGCGYKDN